MEPTLPAIIDEKALLDCLIAELGAYTPSGARKGEELARMLVDDARASGDARKAASVLKLVERRDTLHKEAINTEEPRHPRAYWEALFAFFCKYETLIKREVEQLRQANPDAWSFDWFHPTPDTAPWHRDLYGDEKKEE